MKEMLYLKNVILGRVEQLPKVLLLKYYYLNIIT